MKKLYEKIFKRFALITIIIVLLTDSFFLFYFIAVSVRNAQSSLDSSVSYSSNILEKLSEETELINTLIQKDSDVQEALRNVPKNKNEIYSQKLQINGYFYTLQENNTSYIDSFYVLLDDGRQFKSTNFPLLYDNAFDVPEYKKLRDYSEAAWLSTYSKSLVANNYKNGYVAVSYPLYNVRTGESVGIVVEEILTQTIEENLIAAGYLEDVSAQIYDSNDTLLLGIGEKHRKREAIIESSADMMNGWRLRFACGLWNMVDKTIGMALIIGGLLTGIMIWLSLFLSRRIAASVSEPIHQLLNIMKNEELIQHQEQVTIDTDIFEVKRLFAKYEQMIERLRSLFLELEKKQKALRKSEYAALQAQINPHFLYNTLDNITWKIRTGNQQDAIDEVVSLSRFFRLSLSKGADMVSVKDEMEHVQLYLKLQKKRYGDRFNYEVDSYMRLADMVKYCVPKLILQPLAENAIYHGFEEIKSGGMIHITADCRQGQIIFEVQDNGVGMEAEYLECLNHALLNADFPDQENDKNGYGIFNINARIKNVFGSEYGLILESRRSEGTIARMILPCNSKKEKES